MGTLKAYYGIYYSRKSVNQVLLMIFLLLTSCEEQFWPELGEKYENILVVEGTITNDPGPYTLLLSLSTSFENPVYIPLSGYEAIINDNLGNSEILSEVEPGVYKTAVDGIHGVPGRKYQLTIQSSDGKTYQSDFEELRAPVGIDSVYVELEYRENAGFPFDIPGYQFLLNTKASIIDSSYYLWKLERTFEYHADFRVYFWYDGELHTFPDTDSIEAWSNCEYETIFSNFSSNFSIKIL